MFFGHGVSKDHGKLMAGVYSNPASPIVLEGVLSSEQADYRLAVPLVSLLVFTSRGTNDVDHHSTIWLG